jgi:transcriptional regulator with XRE-family HTH domain
VSLGSQIRELREAQGLTQRELGEMSGVGQPDIGKLERDQANFGTSRLRRVADALGIDMADLVVQGSDAQEEAPPRTFSQDAPPKASAAKKAAAPKKAPPRSGMPPLAETLQLPYVLLSNGLATRLPQTSAALARQAGPCAAAWDNFLLRYPALREKIESGMITADIATLVMAHLPIVQAAREEGTRLRQQAEWDAGAPRGDVAAA